MRLKSFFLCIVFLFTFFIAVSPAYGQPIINIPEGTTPPKKPAESRSVNGSDPVVITDSGGFAYLPTTTLVGNQCVLQTGRPINLTIGNLQKNKDYDWWWDGNKTSRGSFKSSDTSIPFTIPLLETQEAGVKTFCIDVDTFGPAGRCHPGGQNAITFLFENSAPSGDVSCSSDKIKEALSNKPNGFMQAIMDIASALTWKKEINRLPCSYTTSNGIRNLQTVNMAVECGKVTTAIGDIDVTSPAGFIIKLFSIVLTFAGVGAVILIIYSGYKLLISRGDKEKIQAARDTITSTIIGLLFIIFSLVILSVITNGILKLPGFGNSPRQGSYIEGDL